MKNTGFVSALGLFLSLGAVVVAGSAGCDRVQPPSESEAHPMELTNQQTQVYGKRLAELPDDGLRRQGGEPFSFRERTGKPIIVSAVYTNCPMQEMCPLLTSKIGKVQRRALEADWASTDDFRVVLFSFDPERDSPEDLRNYVTTRGVNPINADFVSGTPEAIATVMDELEIATTEGAEGRIDHNMRTYVTDAASRVMFGFRKSDWKPKHVVDRLRTVVEQ